MACVRLNIITHLQHCRRSPCEQSLPLNEITPLMGPHPASITPLPQDEGLLVGGNSISPDNMLRRLLGLESR